jgi:histidinol-phosphate/aromatic aminotransferase/cobyric acid decarboxylase-like protein
LRGHPALIEALQKIRDSYNVNGLGQVAAMATLENSDYYHGTFERSSLAGRRFQAAWSN